MHVMEVITHSVELKGRSFLFFVGDYPDLMSGDGKGDIARNVVRGQQFRAHTHGDNVLLVVGLFSTHEVNNAGLQYNDIIRLERLVYGSYNIAQTQVCGFHDR
jgi:hypothetical protein